MRTTFHLMLIIALLPFLSKGQWAHRYTTGQGNGYGLASMYSTFDGYIRGDSLVTFGFQDISSGLTLKNEFYQDSYDLKMGHFGHSKIIYQRNGSVTNLRNAQAYRRYNNGYIVNRNGDPYIGPARYIRNLDGSLVRSDSTFRILIRTDQLVDSTSSFLCTDFTSNLFLLDWFTGDTIQTFLQDSITSQYQGGLDPNNWNIQFYHNDGNYLYLKVFEPTKVYSYGYEILKLEVTSGKLHDFNTFTEESSMFGTGQNFLMIVNDSVQDFGTNYRSFHSIYDGNWQRKTNLSFTADKFYGNVSTTVPKYFSDSLLIFSTSISDSRVQPDNRKKGSHIRTFDLINEKWLGSSKFLGSNPGESFIIEEILAVKNGYIYLNTQHDVANFVYGMILCLPLDLNYNNPLFLRTLGENETQTGALELFPNPVNDRLRLNFGATFTELQFFNMAGSLVGRLPYSEEDTYSTSFLSPGVYSVAIMDGGKVLAERKLMKKLN